MIKNLKLYIAIMLYCFYIPVTITQEIQDKNSIQNLIFTYIDHYKKENDAFDFLQEQQLISISFYDYLLKNLVQDTDSQSQDANFGDVITQAQELVCDTMKEPFLSTLSREVLFFNNSLAEIKDPIFLYVVNHQDSDFIKYSMYQWLKEWAKSKYSNQYDNLSNIVFKRRTDILQILVDAKVNINIKDINGDTPLFWAVTHNDFQSAKLLVKGGAELNEQDEYGFTFLHDAVDKGYNEIAYAFIHEPAIKLDLQDKLGRTPLCIAVIKNRPQIIQELIQAKADLTIQDNRGFTPLMEAAVQNRLEIVDMLIKAGANLNTRNLNGYTPLCMAVLCNNKDVVKKLIQGRAGVNKKSQDLAPLHIASRKNFIEIAQLLIDFGADLRAQDSLGRTAKDFATTPEMKNIFDKAQNKKRKISEVS